MTDTFLKMRHNHGGWLVGLEGPHQRPAVYSACPGDAIRKLADQNFASDTTAYQSLMWYAASVAKGYQHEDAPAAWNGSTREIKNAWYRATQI